MKTIPNNMNVSQFKKFVEVGQKWQCKDTKSGWDAGVRPITKINSTGVYFKSKSGGNSFVGWPSAKEFSVVNTSPPTIKISFEDDPSVVLVYTLVEE